MRFAFLVILFICLPGWLHAQSDPVDQVDPFIGTQTSTLLDNGNTVPGASRPFGMLSWSPDPPTGIYRRETPVTRGFSLMHLSGPGCGAFGDVPVLPMLGVPRQSPSTLPLTYQAGYHAADEQAQPGFYTVKLDSGITVRLAAAVHSGIAEITFPATADPHTLLLDLSRNLNETYNAQINLRGNQVEGSVAGGAFCGLKNRYTIFFTLEAEQTPQTSATFDELSLYPHKATAEGPRIGGYLQFSPTTTLVRFKVGLSFVSTAKAQANLRAEIPGWDLARVRAEARAAWAQALALAVVSGGTPEQRRVFYTAIYHTLLEPNVFSDVNGDYLGFDGKVHNEPRRTHYANLSGWDIYRSQVQLITMFFPKIGSDIAQSIVDDEQQGGGLPIWPLANDESGCMVGDPSDLILASIYAFGGRDFDTHAALSAMIRGADDTSTHIRLYPERPGLAKYLKRGFISADTIHYGSASVALEYENADFAIAQFATALGDTATASRFNARAAQWRKLFDSDTHYIRPRRADGSFLPKFTPESYDGFIEGNSAQYTWMVPYDLPALIKAIGGDEVVNRRLDAYFSQYGSYQLNRGPFFYIANEPSFGNPWIYNWSGEPWRAQAVVRKTLSDLFNEMSSGLPGNDDLGATSAWIVFAQLGLYPEIPAVAGFTVNSPTFPKAELTFGAHHLTVTAPGAPAQIYLQGLSIDGKPVTDTWIPWSTLSSAEQLRFTMADRPVEHAFTAPPL